MPSPRPLTPLESDPVHIREYQTWVETWDKARAWDKTLASHTLLHALEELGEVSRLIQVLEGYRAPHADMSTIRAELALELSDLQVMLFKIAYQCDIDMEDALEQGRNKADARFPDPGTGPADQAAYWQRFQAYLQAHGLTPVPTSHPTSDTAPDPPEDAPNGPD